MWSILANVVNKQINVTSAASALIANSTSRLLYKTFKPCKPCSRCRSPNVGCFDVWLRAKAARSTARQLSELLRRKWWPHAALQSSPPWKLRWRKRWDDGKRFRGFFKALGEKWWQQSHEMKTKSSGYRKGGLKTEGHSKDLFGPDSQKEIITSTTQNDPSFLGHNLVGDQTNQKRCTASKTKHHHHNHHHHDDDNNKNKDKNKKNKQQETTNKHLFCKASKDQPCLFTSKSSQNTTLCCRLWPYNLLHLAVQMQYHLALAISWGNWWKLYEILPFWKWTVQDVQDLGWIMNGTQNLGKAT